MTATYVERTGNIIVHHPVKPRPPQENPPAVKLEFGPRFVVVVRGSQP